MTIELLLVWITVMCLFITVLPKEKYQRVYDFTQMVLNRIPISKIIELLKMQKKGQK